ncbi:hypothetical protein, partial [Campylobacter jejuni]|uniref:hypothetical protein n=1 Tax=Campylobacter jejuni TaxID=197 RepID=UPI00224210BA
GGGGFGGVGGRGRGRHDNRKKEKKRKKKEIIKGKKPRQIPAKNISSAKKKENKIYIKII